MRQAFKYRLYPTKKQEQVFFWMLARCRELYNAALSEWKDGYQLHERTQLQVNKDTGQVIAQGSMRRSHSIVCQPQIYFSSVLTMRNSPQEIP